MGVSYYYLQKYNEAKDCFTKSLKLKPTYHDAQVWLERVTQSLQEVVNTDEENTIPSTEIKEAKIE